MTSRVRIRSSKAQRHPVPRPPKLHAGKLRSAGNRYTHGFYSRRLKFRPQNGIEINATQAMPAATWPLSRLDAAEPSLLNQALQSS